jgi:hypothetical protein
MTFLVAQLHVPIAFVNALYTKKQIEKKNQKPKTHYKCISVMVHVVKFQPKNKTTKFVFLKVILFWREESRCEERP